MGEQDSFFFLSNASVGFRYGVPGSLRETCRYAVSEGFYGL